MEIGGIAKTEQVEKGFYGESVDNEEFVYNGVGPTGHNRKA